MAVVLETTGESFSLVRIQPGAFSSHRSNTSPGARGQLTVADEVAEESPHSNRSAARRKPGGRDGPGGTGATASPRGSKSGMDAQSNAVGTEWGLRRAPGPSFPVLRPLPG